MNYTWSRNLQFINSPDVFNTSVGKDLVAANPPQVLRITFDYDDAAAQSGFPSSATNTYRRSSAVGEWRLRLYYQTGAYIGRPLAGSNNTISRWLGRGPGTAGCVGCGAQLKKNADGSYMSPWSVDWTDLSGTHHTDPLDINCRCFDPAKTVVLNPNAWQPIPDAGWTSDTSTYSFFRAARRPSESANIARNFRIKEKYTFQIRMEFQNIFNRAFLPAPQITTFSPVNASATLQKGSNGNYIGGFGTFGNLGNSSALGAQRTGQVIARFTF